MVFVTTDPARDTPDVLREYLDRYDPDFVGLTGDVGDVIKASRRPWVSRSLVRHKLPRWRVRRRPRGRRWSDSRADQAPVIGTKGDGRRRHGLSDIEKLAGSWTDAACAAPSTSRIRRGVRFSPDDKTSIQRWPPSPAPRRASGTSGPSRSARTRCASSSGSSSRSGSERRWQPAAHNPARWGCRRLGGAVRAGRRPAVPRDHRPGAVLRGRREADQRALHLGAAARDLGRDGARRRRRLDRLPPPRDPAAALRRRAGAGHRARPGDRPLGQLVQPGAYGRPTTCRGV